MNPSARLSCLVLLATLATSLQAADFECTIDDDGQVAATFRGQDVIVPIAHRDPPDDLDYVRFADTGFEHGWEQYWKPKPVEASFDPEQREALRVYDWGRVAIRYTPRDDGILIAVDIHNASERPLVGARVEILRLAFPRTSRNAKVAVPRVGVSTIDLEDGRMALLQRRPWPSGLAIAHRVQADGSRSLVLSGPAPVVQPHHPVVDDDLLPTRGQAIPPGGSATYRAQVVFGPAKTPTTEVVPEEFLADYREARPHVLDWPDRRPIGATFLCHPTTGWPKNPRGWIFGKKAQGDVTTEAGLAEFREALMAHADRCIEHLQRNDAQGIIVWDVEGQEFPHHISYIGDPRAVPDAAPEMDRFADEFFGRFRDAGFRTGVTIRPTEIFRQPSMENRLWHREVEDPVQLMSDKVAYAKRRWGCTLFYVDSNVFNDAYLEEGQKLVACDYIMPVEMFDRLSAAHPDCLFFPEWAGVDYYATTAPFGSSNVGQRGTDDLIRAIWPEAFRVTFPDTGQLEQYWDEYVRKVGEGDVLLFRAWFESAENLLIRLIYREAELRRSEVYARLADADVDELIATLADGDAQHRYAAASHIGARAIASAQPALVPLLDDDDPLVRKAALTALADMDELEDPALLPRLMDIITAKPGGGFERALRPFAVEAVGRFGEAAVPGLVAVLSDDTAAPAWGYALQALARTGADDDAVSETVLAFLEAEEGPRLRHRREAATCAGKLELRACVPALLELLADTGKGTSWLRMDVVIALGRIGDERAIQPLLAQIAGPWRGVSVYFGHHHVNDALTRITGHQGVVGEKEWRERLAESR